jgi:hypothetical protein
LSLHKVDSCHFIFFTSWGVSTSDLALALTLRGCDLDYFTCMINFNFWSPSHFISWLNRDWHLVICDSSCLAWFLRLNIHLPFSITSHTSMPRLLLALLWCMVHCGQVLVNHSSTIILSHTSLHVFHRLILWKPSYDQVASIDIQYLEVALDQRFLGYDQVTIVEPS